MSAAKPRSRKEYVKRACNYCRKAKVRCDDSRPCLQCVRRGKEDECADTPPPDSGNTNNTSASSSAPASSGNNHSNDKKRHHHEQQHPPQNQQQYRQPPQQQHHHQHVNHREPPPPPSFVTQYLTDALADGDTLMDVSPSVPALTSGILDGEEPPLSLAVTTPLLSPPRMVVERRDEVIHRPLSHTGDLNQFQYALRLPGTYNSSLGVLMTNFALDCVRAAPGQLSPAQMDDFTTLIEHFCGMYIGFRSLSSDGSLTPYAARVLLPRLRHIQRYVGNSFTVRRIVHGMPIVEETVAGVHTNVHGSAGGINRDDYVRVYGEEMTRNWENLCQYIGTLPFPSVLYTLYPQLDTFPPHANEPFLRHMGYHILAAFRAGVQGRPMAFLTSQSRQLLYERYPPLITARQQSLRIELAMQSVSNVCTRVYSTSYFSYMPISGEPAMSLAVYIPVSLGAHVSDASFNAIFADIRQWLQVGQ